MIKIKIQAGLGNQMFQYALARSIKERSKKEVVLDLSYYMPEGVAEGDIPRAYDLEKFNIDESFKKDYKTTPKKVSFLEKFLRKLKNESAFVFYKKYLNPREGDYLIGFWQSEKYFKDVESVIRKEFTLKDKIENRDVTDEAKQCLEKIAKSKNSISINIRRGDYAENKKTRMYHGLISKEYFLEGVNYISNKKGFKKDEVDIFVFSDDIDWCKENLKELESTGNIVFIPETILSNDTLYLISKCQHNIIVNSSFSWWGAWLNNNKDKIVVAPKYWMRAKINTKDICPVEWVKLENRFY